MKKILSSGSELDMTMAPFQDAHNLFQAVLKELKNVNLDLGLKSNTSFTDFFEKDVTDDLLNTLKNFITSLLASKDIQISLQPCLQRCTYNNQKVTMDLFEDEKAREDFIEVLKEVLVFNLFPFFKGASCLLSLPQQVRASINIQK